MSVTYTTTSFGVSPPSSGSGRHQRQSSGSSRSSVTLEGSSSAHGNTGLPLPATTPSSSDRAAQLLLSMKLQDDLITEFMGGRPVPRQNGHSDNASIPSTNGVPPSYDSKSEVESLPTYTNVEEQDTTFNRNLFKWGFVFFPLWIVGIIAPFVKPEHDPARDSLSKEEQEAEYANLRKLEMRWAWRCAAALLVFILVVVVAVVIGVTVSNHH